MAETAKSRGSETFQNIQMSLVRGTWVSANSIFILHNAEKPPAEPERVDIHVRESARPTWMWREMCRKTVYTKPTELKPGSEKDPEAKNMIF
jgi:hypothetical protein